MISENKIAKLAEYQEKAVTDTPARQRLANLFDEGEFTELNAFAKAGNDFTGVITAYGYVDGTPVYAFSQDKTVKSGAVGKEHAEKICKLFDLAAKTGAPIVGIYDSNGAFIDGGADALTAYGEILGRTSNVSGVVPQIAVIAGTCAGSAAMIACSADLVVMTKDGELFMAPPFNTDDTDGAGSAENAAKAGTAHIVCEDDIEAVAEARKLLSMLPMNNLSEAPMFEYAENAAPLAEIDADSIAASIADADSLVELSADFGTASYTALATIGGSVVGIAATNKADEKLTSDDTAKLARFVRTCDAFAIPVITIVDTEGFEVSASAELAGSVRNMTKLAHAYAEATTVKISVIAGEAFGPAYVALASKGANSDLAIAWPSAVITPLAPVTAVEFLWHDKLKGAENLAAEREKLAKEYADTEVSAFNAAEKGCVDCVVNPADTRRTLIGALEALAGKRVSRLPKKHSNMPF